MFTWIILEHDVITRVGGNRKRNQQSTNPDKKSIKTVFLIAICRLTGDKLQTKTLFQLIFYLRSSIVLAFSIAAYPVWLCFEIIQGWKLYCVGVKRRFR